ncbi:uncharacterized protein F4807DRAFT_295615 [Annulohypoxylon truncatum]|uniref:uncharacterized protein n=1 Tax=Annulohypoxylon truncatum TaxID=327061 RepID=UPI002008BEB3|nr:uncharacterized protein F4807DRAFT_295615 [Annulohypoxylon truncatum]KAI1205092.1 hypothetical protein F4807DRAFT_295615 [Annulohypoxylon truncatum]
MTTKPSDALWVDGPFPLVPTPVKRPGLKNPDHFYIEAATDMAQAHNVIIRGLNAIILQAPNVPNSSEEGYKPKDVKDLLSFVQSWTKMVHHHHDVEETYIFPEMAKFSGDPELMEGPWHEHRLFQGGLEKLLAYATATQPDEYRWVGGMKEIIDSFSKHLTDHLYAEIDVLLSFGHFDSEGYRKLWIGTHAVASSAGNLRQKLNMLSDVFPCVYGCNDKTYEGGHSWPELPWIMPYLIKYWFAIGNGAWRFCPSDWWCNPRPLTFAPRAKGQNGRADRA